MANNFFPVLLTVGGIFFGQSGHANTNTSSHAGSSYYNTKSRDTTTTSDKIQKDVRITADTQAQGSKADVETTRKIRERLTDDDALSVQAQNVKIITLGGTITLSGQVDDQSERNKIIAVAKEVGGRKNINNQLQMTNSSRQ